MNQKTRQLKIQLSTAIFALITLLVSGFFVLGPDLVEVVKAVTGNYNKATGDQLTISDWNNLDNDFLDKQSVAGDAMAGPLTLPADPVNDMEAATRRYVDTTAAAASAATDSSGNSLNMVCGRTYLDAGHWSTGDGNMVIYNSTAPIEEHFAAIRIDTSLAGFTSPPTYFASLGGEYNFGVYGVNDIRSYAEFFEVRLFLNGVRRDGRDIFGNYIDLATIESWGWYIDWCGVGD